MIPASSPACGCSCSPMTLGSGIVSARTRLAAAGLCDVAEKVETGVRLDAADGLRLFETEDLLAVGYLANRVRERRHGARTYYNYNMRLEATNVCVASCLFCSFARLRPGDAEAYTLSLEQAWDKLRAARRPAADRSPRRQRPPSGSAVRATTWSCCADSNASGPRVHLKCFTAVEIAFFADLYGMSDEQVLRELMRRGTRFTARAAAPRSSPSACGRRSVTTSATPIASSRFIASRTGSACDRT